MSKIDAKIVPCLWFDTQAEEAANFYVSIFPKGKILRISYYGKSDHPAHVGREGTVLTVEFELNGQVFTALNGGPMFKFTEAISLQIHCDDQSEVDHYWERLREGGDPDAQNCGWLKDKYGVSWQVVPTAMIELFLSPDKVAAQRAMNAMFAMKKLDLAAVQRAFEGKS